MGTRYDDVIMTSYDIVTVGHGALLLRFEGIGGENSEKEKDRCILEEVVCAVAVDIAHTAAQPL